MDMLAECQEMRQPHRWRLKGLCAIGSLTVAAGLYALTAPAVWATGMACVITPYDEISIGTPVEGLIQTVPVERGDWVTKGQVILTLESSFEEATVALTKAKAEAEAALKSSQVKIGFTGRKYERALELFKTNSIAQHEVDEAQTEKALAEVAYREATEQKRQAELELNRATAALQLRTIRSPINGVVVDRLLSPGELARQTPVMKLAQLNPLRVEVFAPLSLLGKLKTGMRAEVRPEGKGQPVLQAKIVVVNKVVDSASGTFGVRLEMPNPNNAISAGLACTVEFNYSSAERP
ncbi:MAG: efflux RND transporter periplasmic adaptor subunit [Nitrospira sp.]